MSTKHEQIVAMQKRCFGLGYGPLGEAVALVLSVLEPMLRPPTEAEVDQSLANIDDAENAAHDCCAACIKYIRAIEAEVDRRFFGEGGVEMSNEFKAMRAAATHYRDLML